MMLYHDDFLGISYNQDTGEFYEESGKRVFREMPFGHLIISYEGKSYLAHRLAWLFYYRSWPNGNIDHINGNPKDNRPENLRDVSHKENMKNCKKRSDNTSGITGVYYHKPSGKWQARGYVDGKANSLGLYVEKEQAVVVRKGWESQNGYHKNHGR